MFVRLFLVIVGSSLVVGYPSVKQESSTERHYSNLIASLQAIDDHSATRRHDIHVVQTPASHPGLTQVITSRPGYASEFNVRQEPAISEDDLQGNDRSRQKRATAEHDDEAEDDSDMFMEPDEEPQQHTSQSVAKPTTTTTETIRPVVDNHGTAQHFFPSFAPVFGLGHTRQPEIYRQPEPAYNHPRPSQLLRAEFNPFKTFRENTYHAAGSQDEAVSSNLLGSGNFGVIRGGTYYSDDEYSESVYNPYYSNNGHGRPSFYSNNPRPQKYSSGDFFANFRDFADINTPTKTSFSQYVVVYVNKNASKHDTVPTQPSRTRPKNIIEQLSLIDKEKEEAEDTAAEVQDEHDVEDQVPKKKTSNHKRKLEKFKKESLSKQKKKFCKKVDVSKELYEPLLALS